MASQGEREATNGAVANAVVRTSGGGSLGGVVLEDLELGFLGPRALGGGRDGKGCETAVVELVLDRGSGARVARFGTPKIRSSRRLAAEEATPILIKAVARKARREACVGRAGGIGADPSIKKILGGSRMCGVRLDDGAANSFRGFVVNKR